MEEVIKIRLSKAEKEQLMETARVMGITLSELVIKSLKLKRRKRVKPRNMEKINNFSHQAA